MGRGDLWGKMPESRPKISTNTDESGEWEMMKAATILQPSGVMMGSTGTRKRLPRHEWRANRKMGTTANESEGKDV